MSCFGDRCPGVKTMVIAIKILVQIEEYIRVTNEYLKRFFSQNNTSSPGSNLSIQVRLR